MITFEEKLDFIKDIEKKQDQITLLQRGFFINRGYYYKTTRGQHHGDVKALAQGFDWLRISFQDKHGNNLQSPLVSVDTISLGRYIAAQHPGETDETYKELAYKYIQPYIDNQTDADKTAKAVISAIARSRQGKTKKLTTYSFADIPAMNIKPPEFVIQKILPVGLTVFGARPKTGKSFASIDICNAVATGTTWMGLKAIEGDALYLDLEGSPARLKSRLGKMGIGMAKRASVSHNSLPIDGGLLDQLEDWCNTASNPKLIIVDTLARVQGSKRYGEHDNERDTRTQAPLQAFALRRNLAIIIITHLKKQGNYQPSDPFEKILGTMGIYDTMWAIEGKRMEDEKHLLITGRDVGQYDYTIERSEETGRWSFVGDTEELAELKARQSFNDSPVVKTIVSKCLQNWEISARDLINEVALATGEYPASDPTRMGRFLHDIAPMLYKEHGIITTFPKQSDNPKKFRFRRKDLLQ